MSKFYKPKPANCPDCGVPTMAHNSRTARCRPCAAAWRVKRDAAILERSRAATAARRAEREAAKADKVPPPPRTIACERCGEVVPWRQRKRFCGPCAGIRKAEWSKEKKADPVHRKRRAEIAREYAKRHPDRVKRRLAAYRAATKGRPRSDEERSRRNEAERVRRASDPAFAINKRMSCAVRRAIKKGFSGRSWRHLVGYGPGELMAHLERQFARGMTWENMGEWHIDHIVPLVEFDYSSAEDPDFRAAWALTNLRPLWGTENARKGGKRLTLL